MWVEDQVKWGDGGGDGLGYMGGMGKKGRKGSM